MSRCGVYLEFGQHGHLPSLFLGNHAADPLADDLWASWQHGVQVDDLLPAWILAITLLVPLLALS